MSKGLRYRTMAVLAAMVLAASTGGAVSAEESTLEETAPEISVVDITEIDITETPNESAGAAASLEGPIPVDISMEEESGYQMLKKTYVVKAEVSPNELIEQNLTRHGVEYQYLEVLKEELPGSVETKTVSQTKAVQSDTKDTAAIAAAQEQTLPYEENGYIGELKLEAGNIQVSEGEKVGYSYRVTDVREYPGLASNDPYLVPKEVNKNGVSLALENIQWTPSGVKPDGSGLPSGYTATASYGGTGWGSKVSGYNVTLTYSGEVSKTIPGQVQYTLVYEEVKPEPFWTSWEVSAPAALTATGAALLIVVLAVTLYHRNKGKQEREKLAALPEQETALALSAPEEAETKSTECEMGEEEVKQ